MKTVKHIQKQVNMKDFFNYIGGYLADLGRLLVAFSPDSRNIMTEKMLFIQNDFETFTASWGSVVSKVPYNNGFICPLGWEEELTAREIEFTEIDYEIPVEEEIIN